MVFGVYVWMASLEVLDRVTVIGILCLDSNFFRRWRGFVVIFVDWIYHDLKWGPNPINDQGDHDCEHDEKLFNLCHPRCWFLWTIHIDFVVQDVLAEAQFFHVAFDFQTVEIFGAITAKDEFVYNFAFWNSSLFTFLYLPIARFQFGSFGLSSQDVDAIHASVCTLFASEHCLAKSVIIFQSGWAQRVSGTNPLGGWTWNYGIFSCGIHDFFLTGLNIEFTLFAKIISCAITLKIREKEKLAQCHLVLLKVTKTWADFESEIQVFFDFHSVFLYFKNNVFPIYFYAFLRLFHAWFIKAASFDVDEDHSGRVR